jgi:hypothetical protein
MWFHFDFNGEQFVRFCRNRVVYIVLLSIFLLGFGVVDLS